MKLSELTRAACEGNAKRVLAAIKAGANVNSRYRGRPILFWAVQEGHLKVAKVLLASGASLKRRDSLGFSALDQAVGEGNIRMVRLLLKAGAKINGPTVNGSPLHTACAYRPLEIAKLLLKLGADPSAVDADGRTPAALAIMGKRNGLDSKLRTLLLNAQRACRTGRPARVRRRSGPR